MADFLARHPASPGERFGFARPKGRTSSSAEVLYVPRLRGVGLFASFFLYNGEAAAALPGCFHGQGRPPGAFAMVWCVNWREQ